MYKSAKEFQDYMNRTNKFTDRIIRGGNKIDASIIMEETDGDLLLGSYQELRECLVKSREQMMRSNAEKKAVNRETRGRPDNCLPPSLADVRSRAVTKFNNDLRDVERLEYCIELIRGRLQVLGRAVQEHDRPFVVSRGTMA